MFITVILLVIWTSIAVYGGFILYTLVAVGRYKDLALTLDTDRIASYPYQPPVILAVRCDLRAGGIPDKLRRLLSLNYIRYELIVLADSAVRPEAFRGLITAFRLEERSMSQEMSEEEEAVRGIYSGEWNAWQRIVLVDLTRTDGETMKKIAVKVGRGDFLVWLDSVGNRLAGNSLIEMSLLRMRDPSQTVTRVRAVSRYGYPARMRGNLFRMMADVCSLRRQYVGGPAKWNDFGQYVLFDSTKPGKGGKRREEFMPRPQMIVYRRNHFRTYLRQVCPRRRPANWKGKGLALLEFLLATVFWGAGIALLARYDRSGNYEFLLISVVLLFLLCSTFAIFMAEVVLRDEQKPGVIGRLILVSFLETLLFFLLKPFLCLIRLLTRRDRSVNP